MALSLLRLLRTMDEDPRRSGMTYCPNCACVECSKKTSARRKLPNFTVIERGVLDRLILGCSNDEIAAMLNRSVVSVKKTVSTILDKTHLPSRARLIVWAYEHAPELREWEKNK